MSQEFIQRIKKLEDKNGKQQAQVGLLQQQVEKLQHEKQVLEMELKEERLQHTETRDRISELIEAVNHADERYRMVLRREFGASSERLLGKQELLEACLDDLDPDTQQALRDLQASTEAAAQAVASADAGNGPDHVDADQPDAAPVLEASSSDRPEEVLSEKPRSQHKRPSGSGGRKPLPDDCPHVEMTFIPQADHPALKGALAYETVATRLLQRMALAPMQVIVQDITCPVMSLRYPGDIRTQQTIAPPAVMGNGQADDSILIHSACDKILDHLPSYRQSQRFARIGMNLHRSKLCRWHIALATFLEAIAAAIFTEIAAEHVVGIDDTVHRLVDTELHRCKQGRLWAVTGSKNAFYFFSETREGKWIADLLGDFNGAIMGDAYAGHNALLSLPQITALFCWAHVRRKFFEAPGGLKRQQMLHLIGRLYDLERDLADQPPDIKVAARTQTAGPILASIKQLLDAWQADPKVLPKSGMGRATTYALNNWDGLQAYLSIGEAPIDNNRTERAVRPNALHRKNALFSASVKGAEAYATLSTIIQTACAHDLNPETYLAAVIEDLHYGRRTPEELTPAQFAARMASVETVQTPS